VQRSCVFDSRGQAGSHCRKLINAARTSQEAYEDLAEEEAAMAKVLAK